MNVNNVNKLSVSFFDKNARLLADALSVRGLEINLKVMAIAVVTFAALGYLCFRVYQWMKKDQASVVQKPLVAEDPVKSVSQTDSKEHSTDVQVVPVTTSDVSNVLNSTDSEPESNVNGKTELDEQEKDSTAEVENGSNSETSASDSSDVNLPNVEPVLTGPEKEPELLETPPPVSPENKMPPEPINVREFFLELDQRTMKLPFDNFPFSSSSCRFNNIFCPKDTHVETDVEILGHYLHANHVKLEGHHFIAAQYPLFPETFWEVCKNSRLIVDLTNSGDMNKGLVPYASEDIEMYQNFTVKQNEKEKIEDLTASHYSYKIAEKSNTEDFKLVDRLHYEAWPDFGGITAKDLDKLVDIINTNESGSDLPVVVHCRAGVGRTGTTIVASVLKPLIQEGIVTPYNLKEKMAEIILEGRRQRGPMFVQSPEQLQSLCNWCQYLFEQESKRT